jgi:hypothetical protein
MELDEIDFWMAATADYNRTVGEAMSARRDNRQCPTEYTWRPRLYGAA